MRTGLLRFLLLFTFLCGVMSVSAKDKVKTVYAFGYAVSLGDSVAYLSNIQVIDSVTVNAQTGFLENHGAIARQMEEALSAKYGKHFTCALFYKEEKKDIEKAYVSLRKHLKKEKDVRVEEIPESEFKFVSITTQLQ